MWRSLLLIAHATCEWVEISQHHYKKPIKTYATTEVSTEVYSNQTISHVWTDHRHINTRLDVSSVRNKYMPDIGHEDINDAREKDFIGTVEKVPNIGLIRRVQLLNTPVKSPLGESTSAANQLYSNFEVSLENLDKSEELHRRVFYNKRKPVYNTKATVNTDVTKIPFGNYSLSKHDDGENHFVTLNTRITNDNNFRSKSKISKVTQDELVTNPTKIASDTSAHDKPSKINHGKQNFDTIENTSPTMSPTKENIINEENNQQNKRKSGPDTKKFETIVDFDETKTNYKDSTPTAEETPTRNKKVNTMGVLMKIIKTVADTISKNSHRTLNSKLRYLHELKNTMLDNIGHRIDSIWPDDTVSQNGARRRVRNAYDAARGHMEFPSSESTLMTISFLTFAVFLIKLVLQVIQTYKNKAMMVAPLVVAAAGRTAVQRLQSNKITNKIVDSVK